jgi:hypothetical protein
MIADILTVLLCVMCRVGQNRIYTLYLTLYSVSHEIIKVMLHEIIDVTLHAIINVTLDEIIDVTLHEIKSARQGCLLDSCT